MSHDQPEWDFVLCRSSDLFRLGAFVRQEKSGFWVWEGGERKKKEKKNVHTKKFEKERNRGKNIKSIKKKRNQI